MPNRLSARIALAFSAVAVVTLLAVGGTLFVALRALHTEAASAALAQTTQPLVVQLRGAGGTGDVLFTTAGAISGATYDILLWVEKSGNL